MLTKESAQTYSKQLHPAFAGYLHDGIVSERDSLAAIFHLVQKSILEIEWEDGSLAKQIKAIKPSTKPAVSPFEKNLLETLFRENDKVSARNLGIIIKDGVVAKIILQNLSAIQTFPIINTDIEFDHGSNTIIPFLHKGRIVDTLEETRTFEGETGAIVGLFLISSILLLVITNDYVDIPRAILGTRPMEIDMITIASISAFFAFAALYISFKTAKKQVSYSFKNQVVPLAQKKYAELYDFLKSYPIENHNMNNEFLAYSIAFGIDNSWLADFGLVEEPVVDESPLIDY